MKSHNVPLRVAASVQIGAMLLWLLLVVPAAAAEVTHEGKVVSAANAKISIVDKNGDSETFDVAADAKITLDDKEAALEDLVAGCLVKVTVKPKGAKQVAVEIRADSPK